MGPALQARNGTLPVVRVVPAYADRDRVWDMLMTNGPYPQLWSTVGYDYLPDRKPIPWFRSHWALGGESLIADADEVLYNEAFLEASKEAFGATVVQPQMIALNVTGPMAAGPVHRDAVSFRGLTRAEAPLSLLAAMEHSGLFERWLVQLSSALTWFYDGPGGAFNYWPDGVGGPRQQESSPFGNVAVVCDNDHIFHQIDAVGTPDQYLPDGAMTAAATISPSANGWAITEQGAPVASYALDEVRVSLLWKAEVFADARAAAIRADHSDDLTLERVVDTFSADLSSRGIACTDPSDPISDREWNNLLATHYGFVPPVVAGSDHSY